MSMTLLYLTLAVVLLHNQKLQKTSVISKIVRNILYALSVVACSNECDYLKMNFCCNSSSAIVIEIKVAAVF